MSHAIEGECLKLPRRRFLQLAAGAAALPALADVASSDPAQSYPSRPVRIVVGYPAGGVSDILARLVGQRLSERLGRAFVVDNRPGAGSNIATEFVVRAAPDGHTLLLAGVANAINVTLYADLSFNFIRDITPVALIESAPLVMEVHPSVPATTVPEFIAYARANPGAITMASAGTGGGSHVAGELFKMMASVDLVHVPYHGSPPALTDLLAGQVQVMFDNVASSIDLIRTGRLRALAVTAATRIPQLGDLPTVGDFVPGYEASGWNGIVAPRNTPTGIIDVLNREINATLSEPAMQARFADLGSTAAPTSPAGFERLIVADTEKWKRVVKFAGIKPG
jgi:tripartite-type tricarboxylate transporter receptor subunit TctC